MTPKRHSSGLSVALRLVLMVCIQQILCSQAKTTRQTVPHMTQFITPIDAFKSHVHQTTEAVTPTETKENIKTRGVVDTATPPSITEVNAKDNHGKLFQTTEKITSSGNRIIHLLWSRKESETYTPSIFPAVTADEKETVAHTSDSPKRPLTEDPNELQKGTTIFNENRCIPTSGMDAVNGQNHCRESDNETVVAREMTNVSTPSLDEMTYSSLETPVSETTAVSEISNYLSMLPYLCPHANLCEKLTKKMSCCRTCSCAQDCGENCCFKNRTEAKHSEIVTECLPVQRELPGKFVSNYRTYNIVRKCRFPVIALFSMPGQLDNSWKTKLSPVFSNRTNMTYYNMDYAKCHAEYQADLVHWNRVEVCPSFSGQTYDKLHESILSRNCDTIYNPPSEYEDVIQECYHIDVNACNVTGDWDYYDQQIEQGCKSLNFPYTVEDVFNYHIKPKLFANAFCYLCNNKHGVKVSAHCTIGNIWNPDSFMTILSYTEENAIKPYTPEFSISGRNESECGVYQIPDTTKVCQQPNYFNYYHKILKIRTPETFAVITLKFELGGITVE